jgi:hypothetical protein
MQRGNLPNLASALLNHQGSKTSNKDKKKLLVRTPEKEKKLFTKSKGHNSVK